MEIRRDNAENGAVIETSLVGGDDQAVWVTTAVYKGRLLNKLEAHTAFSGGMHHATLLEAWAHATVDNLEDEDEAQDAPLVAP